MADLFGDIIGDDDMFGDDDLTGDDDLLGDDEFGDDDLTGDDEFGDDDVGDIVGDIIGDTLTGATRGRRVSRSRLKKAVNAKAKSMAKKALRKRAVGRTVRYDPFKPTRVREYVQGFDSLTAIPAAGVQTITQRPQIPFRPERLVVPSDIAGLFLLQDVKVGKNSQFASTQAVPARVFDEKAVGVRLGLDTAQISQDLVLVPINFSAGPQRFFAAMIGTALDQLSCVHPLPVTDARALLARTGPLVSYKILFKLGSFRGDKDRDLANKALSALLSVLIYVNQNFLRAHPETPLLYKSGVRYKREQMGVTGCPGITPEQWGDIPTVLRDGGADCEDLACWRVAELRERFGIQATAFFYYRRVAPNKTLYHIQVEHPDGTIEDPSAELGMNSRAPEFDRTTTFYRVQ